MKLLNMMKYLIAFVLPLTLTVVIAAVASATSLKAPSIAVGVAYEPSDEGNSFPGAVGDISDISSDKKETDKSIAIVSPLASSAQAQLPAPLKLTTVLKPVTALDTAPPTVFNLRPADGAFTTSMPVISYDYTDPSGIIWPDGVHLFIDDRCSRTLPGTTDITASRLTYTAAAPLAEGPHQLEAFLCDKAYNCGSTFWTIKVDSLAPAILEAAPTGTLNNPSVNISATFSDGDGSGVDTSRVTVTLDGNQIEGCLISAESISCLATGLADGTHTATVDAYDKVGNHSFKSWNFTIDTASVGVTSQVPLPGIWVTTAQPLISVSFQAAPSGTVDVSSIKLFLDSVDVTPYAEKEASGVRYLPPEPLSEGIHRVRVSVHDDAGHFGEDEWTFNVDTLPPDITDKSPTGMTEDRRPDIMATFSDAGSGINVSSVRIFLDGHDQTPAAALDQYKVKLTLPEELSSGSHTAQVTVADLAGNSRTSAWSFSVPAAPLPEPITPGSNDGARQQTQLDVRYSMLYQPFLYLSAPGKWVLSGFSVWPNSWYLPWYDSGPAGGPPAGEIIISNEGAGDAFVNVFVAGEEKWHDTIAEGDSKTLFFPATTGGPVKIVCPTGQSLKVIGRVNSQDRSLEIAALPEEELEPAYLLPWYDAQPGGEGKSSLVVANAGGEEALVDVFVGDPALPQSLKSHLTVTAGTAAVLDLPGVKGGVVKVVSTNSQPLIVAKKTTLKTMTDWTMGTGLLHQDKQLTLELSPGQNHLFVGNSSTSKKQVEIATASGKPVILDDMSTEFTIPPGGALALNISTSAEPGEKIYLNCTSCSFGEGLVAEVASL